MATFDLCKLSEGLLDQLNAKIWRAHVSGKNFEEIERECNPLGELKYLLAEYIPQLIAYPGELGLDPTSLDLWKVNHGSWAIREGEKAKDYVTFFNGIWLVKTERGWMSVDAETATILEAEKGYDNI